MKIFCTILFSILMFNSFGQNPNSVIKRLAIISPYDEKDSMLKVFYDTTNLSIKNPAYILNGRFIAPSLFQFLQPNSIGSIDVIKRDTVVDNIQYYGQIQIKTKGNYIIKPVSLTQLKINYTDLKKSATIFLINNEIIKTSDYDKYFVDENYILNIVVEKVYNQKEGLELSIVKLYTKSEENIKRSKEIKIRLRGTEMALTK